jgi:hypothetical protein
VKVSRRTRMLGTARDWTAERRLVLVTGIAAGLPIIVATLDVVTSGWTPIADDALIAVSAYDVPTGDSPLLGPWSSGYSAIVGQPAFHPGPLLFWLLAIPAHLPWDWTLELTIGLVNLACVMGVVGLAHRRGGRPLMFATAVALPVMLASLPAEAYSDIWNPYAPLLPLLLLLFLAWCIGCGDYRLLWLAVLAASFAPQSHLSFLAPAAGALAVGVIGLVVSRRSALLRPPARAWIAAAVIVGVVCWSFPAIDQVTNSPGNLRLLYHAARADQAKLGLTTGWHGLVHTVGVVPWWLRDPQFGLERVVDLSNTPNALTTGSAVLFLAALAALLVVAWRRRRQDLAVAAALALVSCAAVLGVVASTPRDSFVTLSYSIRWVSPVGMWVWLVAGWSLATMLRSYAVRLAPSGRGARTLALAAPGAVAAVAIVVAAGVHLESEPWGEMRTIADHLKVDLPRDRPARLVVAGSPDATYSALGIQSGIVYALRRDGRRVVAEGLVDYLGPEYGPERAGATQLLRIDAGTTPPSNARLLVRVPVSKRQVSVSLVPTAGGR